MASEKGDWYKEKGRTYFGAKEKLRIYLAVPKYPAHPQTMSGADQA
jgi:hypothetical protein